MELIDDDYETMIVFPAAHPLVGNMEILEENDELVVIIGKITHKNFGNYEGKLSNAEKAERITENVINFLAEVFADRIEFFDGVMFNTCRKRKRRRRNYLYKILFGSKTYIWSGPV